MNEYPNTLEEVMTDENFLAWYHNGNKAKANLWTQSVALGRVNQDVINEAITFLQLLTVQEQTVAAAQLERAYKKIMQKVESPKIRNIFPLKKLWYAAAAVVLLCLAGFAFWQFTGNQTSFGTTYGSVTEFRLPDGSKVMLNANSKIILHSKWINGKDREVWLKGEGFFKVVKTELKTRFIVHANNMDIIVTGTHFNVVNREDESSVLLTEGHVTVKTKDGNEIKMEPGDFVKLENSKAARETVNEDRVLAWQQNKLVFDNTPLTEVAGIISRYYGVRVVFEDSSIGQKRIGGVMPNDNLDVLVQSLKAISEFKITKKENEIIISNP